MKQKIRERKKNIKKIGFDYFQNEPNLKESQGSLRDINIIYWSLKILNVVSPHAKLVALGRVLNVSRLKTPLTREREA